MTHIISRLVGDDGTRYKVDAVFNVTHKRQSAKLYVPIRCKHLRSTVKAHNLTKVEFSNMRGVMHLLAWHKVSHLGESINNHYLNPCCVES